MSFVIDKTEKLETDGVFRKHSCMWESHVYTHKRQFCLFVGFVNQNEVYLYTRMHVIYML